MSANLPPPPYQEPMQNANGFLTIAWSQWFQVAFQRMGAVTAKSNLELETSSTTNLTALQTQVTALQTQVDGIAEVADLNQGRQL